MEQVREVHFIKGIHGSYRFLDGEVSPVASLFDECLIPYDIRGGGIYLSDDFILYPNESVLELLTTTLKYISTKESSYYGSDFFSPRFTINRPPNESEQIHREQCLINFSHVEQLDEPLVPDELKYHKKPFLVDCLRKGEFYYIQDEIGSQDILHKDNLLVTEDYIKQWNDGEYAVCRKLRSESKLPILDFF